LFLFLRILKNLNTHRTEESAIKSMFTSDANQVGNLTTQSVLIEPSRVPARLLDSSSVFVLPAKNQSASQESQANPHFLLGSESGFGNFLNYMVSSLGGTTLLDYTKSLRRNTLSASSQWKDAFNSEINPFNDGLSSVGFIPSLEEKAQTSTPFSKTLNLVF
jgi:hypothetical protein